MTDQRSAVGRWLRIRARFDMHSVSLEHGFVQLAADAEHSALLARLLAGREPHAKPPPRRHSYPWYELVEEGYGVAWEVRLIGKGPYLVIDQGAQWDVQQTIPGGWRVRCTSNEELYDVVEAVSPQGIQCWHLTRVVAE